VLGNVSLLQLTSRLLNLGLHKARANWYSDLFRIDSLQISALLFARAAIAVGAPLLIFALAGRRTAAVVAGATALFVSLSDIGRTQRGRIGCHLVRTAINRLYMLAQIALAAIVAAFDRLGFALNAALGYMAFTVFVILIVELALASSVPPSVLVLERLYDVSVGCLIAGIMIWLRTSK
jgi:hypothetical protein